MQSVLACSYVVTSMIASPALQAKRGEDFLCSLVQYEKRNSLKIAVQAYITKTFKGKPMYNLSQLC